MPPVAAVGESFRSFFAAVEDFFSGFAEVHLGSLVFALLCFGIYLTLRARASFHILRAAYPTETFRFRDVWGAYFAGYGFNSVIPARGGDVVRLFLTKTSVPRSSYPAVGATFVVEAGFDIAMGVLILTFAFTQGVFPKPPDFADLNAFDLSYLASHPRFALFFFTVLGVASMVVFAMLSVRVKAFWARVRQGLTIAFDRQRYFREVFAVPFTPQGAGVAQALLAKVFADTAPGATVAAYSVGQQIAIGAFTFGVGFLALVFIFRMRSFKEIVSRGREDREGEKAARDGTPAQA